MVGQKQATLIRWTRKAIESVGSAITRGLQFFKNHNADNSTDGRKSLGEVVGHFSKEIGGKLHQIVIGHFPDKNSTADCDVCSIEADAVLEDDAGNGLIATAISKLTGIALANSGDEMPAFAGAVRLGRIQAFEPVDPDAPEGKTKTKRKEIPMTTFEDVIKFVKDQSVWPNQLFDEEVLKNDRIFGAVYKERDTLKSQFTDMEKKFTASEEEKKTIQKDAAKTGAEARFKKLFPEGTTDKQKKFLEDRFNPEKIEDITDDGLQKHVDSELEEFKKMASIFGDTNPGDPIKKTEKTDPDPDTDNEELDDVTKVVNNIASDE